MYMFDNNNFATHNCNIYCWLNKTETFDSGWTILFDIFEFTLDKYF